MAKRESRDIDGDPTAALQPPKGPGLPSVEFGHSVTRSLGEKVDLDPAVRLRDLAGEAPLPTLRQGAGRYAIVGELGEGGMGKVFLAYDRDLKRRVALKVIKTGVAEPRRFLAEVEVLAQLDHPSIVPLHDLGVTEAGQPYYTMRVVRGQSQVRDSEIGRWVPTLARLAGQMLATWNPLRAWLQEVAVLRTAYAA